MTKLDCYLWSWPKVKCCGKTWAKQQTRETWQTKDHAILNGNRSTAAAALRGVQGALEAARGYGRRAGGGPNSHAHLGSALDVLGLEEIQTIPKDLWDVCFVFLSK